MTEECASRSGFSEQVAVWQSEPKASLYERIFSLTVFKIGKMCLFN